jgi:hypothetical protein
MRVYPHKVRTSQFFKGLPDVCVQADKLNGDSIDIGDHLCNVKSSNAAIEKVVLDQKEEFLKALTFFHILLEHFSLCTIISFNNIL